MREHQQAPVEVLLDLDPDPRQAAAIRRQLDAPSDGADGAVARPHGRT